MKKRMYLLLLLIIPAVFAFSQNEADKMLKSTLLFIQDSEFSIEQLREHGRDILFLEYKLNELKNKTKSNYELYYSNSRYDEFIEEINKLEMLAKDIADRIRRLGGHLVPNQAEEGAYRDYQQAKLFILTLREAVLQKKHPELISNFTKLEQNFTKLFETHYKNKEYTKFREGIRVLTPDAVSIRDTLAEPLISEPVIEESTIIEAQLPEKFLCMYFAPKNEKLNLVYYLDCLA